MGDDYIIERLQRDNIVGRWEKTGLLDDIPDEEKETLSHVLHAGALYLTDDDIEQRICAVLIPAIRRIYDINKDVAIHFTKLCEMLESSLNENDPKLVHRSIWDKVVSFFFSADEIDWEAEVEDWEFDAVTKVCDDYVEKYTR